MRISAVISMVLAFVKPATKQISIDQPAVAERGCTQIIPLTESKRVFLNVRPESATEREIFLLGSAGGRQSEAPVVQKMKNGTEMVMNSDGSYIVRDGQGVIIKTCDVMKTKREFARDAESGELMVRRFGLWTKPTAARLDKDGNFFWKNHQLEVEERLNGLNVQINRHTGVMIQTHHKSQLEIVKLANGEVWRRQISQDKETFCMWSRGKLTFKSATLFSPERHTIDTPNGKQSIVHVSRLEESWNEGLRTREKYTFRNLISNEKHVNVSISLSSGTLVLKHVKSVITTFNEGEPAETTYQLHQPMNIKIDVPSARTTLEDIVKVRNFEAGTNIGLSFETSRGDEYIIFTGTKTTTVARQRADDDGYDMGAQPADLVLR